MTAKEKVAALRRLMAARKVEVLYVPSSDPHQSEYVAPRWQARKWVSGFTGSAGTLVITAKRAGLWADGRYFIQAERELKGNGIDLFKIKEPGVPTPAEWIGATVKPGQAIAFDGRVVSMETRRDLEKAVAGKAIRFVLLEDLVGRVWADRPAMPASPAYDFPVSYAGKACSKKLAEARSQLKDKKADVLLLASLDDIAWLFNIRGNDIANSPVVLSYALVGKTTATLFADPAKFAPALRKRLAADGVRLRPYEAIEPALKALPRQTAVCLNPRRVNCGLAGALPKTARRVEVTADITTELKAIKNPVELKQLRKAALIDGVALAKFFAWLERALVRGDRVTEHLAGERLAAFRREAPECKGDSFPAICGYGANAAMMHYSALQESSAVLKPKGLFLVDSGGQYFEGTMDTTRTFAMGPVPAVARRHYTLVLKSLIALSQARFLSGTTGTQLDTLARAPLWAEGLNYRCGTGHGVGFYLNVHEGPQGFSPAWSPVPLKPGMVLTIEPGVYLQGHHGIRIENMASVEPDQTTESGEFYRFETFTVCPIDTAPLLAELLNPAERDWLNRYHRIVWNKLSPLLGGQDRAWLKRKTTPV